MGVIYASPDGGEWEFEGQRVDTLALPVAVTRAQAGDTVQLVPATYREPVVMDEDGRSDAPVVLRGGDGVVLDGGQPPQGPIGSHMTPTESDFAFISVRAVQHLVIEGLTFENCWPTAIFARGSRNLTIRDCRGTGAQFFVFARNRRRPFGRDVLASDITLERLHWVQDPEARMWRGEISWKSVKAQGPKPHHTYLGGALFGSFDIAGDVRIVDCHVAHAFNGVRCESRPDPDLNRNRTANFEITGCTFEYIRDNAVEPEVSAQNWWVHHNRFRNVHAVYSLHSLSGGHFYIFGNQHWFDSKPDDISNTGGKMFKFHASNPQPAFPIYVFHNSFFTRSTYTKDGETRHLQNWNNAIEFCFRGEHCKADRQFFSDDHSHFIWHPTYSFRGDASNHPDFPDKFPPAWGYRIEGTATDTLFEDGRTGNLALAPGSGALRATLDASVVLPDGTIFELPAGRDVGALQDGAPFVGPDYQRVSYEG